ncbi:hypothetical protein PN466_05210 [Roseofilum reptotaenium CS-1145]|uniref:DUF4435 domain-containing protein n=1 Tax=Roseofilum reptotaenium AO1-A TaxID=1925591 RepID=A0A1L9QV09_9CYAN|nr:DUF3226 domain-containing protein [Roseofilum reptotaenium]MDB9516356.1 hypothetical protein [Roseofilum reptotaenium CS-1145]OJJ26437.1 hypothetical protein BI308_06175 [Roseofilum reptotaenium AO1-A]
MSQTHPTVNFHKPRVILGEGKDEQFFFSGLIKYLQIKDIQIEVYGGKDNLKQFLKAAPLIPGFSSVVALGITGDADASFTSKSQSIQRQISEFRGYPNVSSDLRINYFILPDHQNSGMLEDLVLKTLSDKEMSCIEEFISCMESSTSRRIHNFSKAKVNAWLASQDKPDRRLGEAAQAGYIDWEHSACERLIEFVQNL